MYGGNVGKMKMDFLLVGFVKAGTSSLDSILRQDRRILLSKVKETHFLSGGGAVNKGTIEMFWSVYYPKVRKNSLVGGIEPTYSSGAEKVYKVFGPDVKLIFMMRNPVQADWSLFKMGLRAGGTRKLVNWYRKYKISQIGEMYHKYTMYRIKNPHVEDYIMDTFRYEKWIKEYLEYYSLESMKFILFEDFIKDAEKTVSEVEEFIGLKARKTNCNIYENEGHKVTRNYFCAEINFITKKMVRLAEDHMRRENLGWLFKLRQKLIEITSVEVENNMQGGTECILKEYYKPTKQYIEQLLSRDLSSVWF